MSVEKYDWVEKITHGSKIHLEPVEGNWGLFYAGSDRHDYNCIIIPNKSISKKQRFGIFEISSESSLFPSDCIKVEWDSSKNEIALPFIEDLLKTQNVLEKPKEIIHKKKAVWKKIDENGLEKYINELTGLWGEMAFIVRNSDMAQYWIGPGGTDRDFSSEFFDLEIKTTRKKSGREVSITSIDQMASKKDKFYLLYNSIEFSSEDGKSLNDLFEVVTDLNISTPTLSSIQNQMKKFGKTLCNMKFRLRFSEAYKVDDDFPLITKKLVEQIIGEAKISHITSLNYSINLIGLSYIGEEELLKLIAK